MTEKVQRNKVAKIMAEEGRESKCETGRRNGERKLREGRGG